MNVHINALLRVSTCGHLPGLRGRRVMAGIWPDRQSDVAPEEQSWHVACSADMQSTSVGAVAMLAQIYHTGAHASESM